MSAEQGISTSGAGFSETPAPEPPELLAVATLLRQAREAQGLTQESLAERLHMGLQQLRALEAADGSSLPEPVFVIAQARRIADALGLEISGEIEQLRRCAAFSRGAPALKAEAFAQAARPAPPNPSPATSRRSWPGVVLVVLVVVAGGYAATRLPGRLPAVPWPAVPQPRTQLKPKPKPRPAAPVSLLLQSAQPSWIEVRKATNQAVLYRGLLRGQRSFRLEQGLRVLAGRPDLVQVRLPGQPARPLGPIAPVRWITLAAPPASP